MNGRNGTTVFLPLDSKIGGQGRNDRPSIINTDTIEQEMEQEEQLSKIDDTNGETNPYQELVVNNAEKIEPLMTQMEQWSILSNIRNYVQHIRFH